MNPPPHGKIVRIGCPSGFWGDSVVGAPQLVRRARVDYLMLDYLAEVTMSILVRAQAKDPTQGYARDFVSVAMDSIVADVAAQGVKIVTNAGGVNPRGCADALSALFAKRGASLKVAVVYGDDVMPLIPELRSRGMHEMFSGAPMPARLVSANAYLGALPIAAALARGADIVVTGRCADSALALGVLMHEFDWRPDEFDKMAAGSLVGHILECGAQVTGGIHTDWEEVERWEDIGYPIAECAADGSFVLTKPDGTGGLVSPATVAEQMLYEIADPACYVLPDVIADFSEVTLKQVGRDRVAVTGARGLPATTDYKVSATFMDGWRCIATLSIIGIDAARKAERTAKAILERTSAILREQGLREFRETNIEIIGSEAIYGPHSRARNVREVIMRIAATHETPDALEILSREIAPAGTSFSPGVTGYAGGRPKPQPIVRLFSFLVSKSTLPAPIVELDGETTPISIPPGRAPAAPVATGLPDAVPPPEGPQREVPLIRLAWGRSGDKGDMANIAVIARRPEYVPILRRELTADRMRHYFSHLVKGQVERFEAPGIGAFNFVLHQALGGGGMASLRNDAQAKSFAQLALDIEIPVPASWSL